jgi:hypothetical protein
MTSKFIGPNMASINSGHLNLEEILEANKQTLMLAGLVKITLSKRAHQVKDTDFVTINDQPCRIETTTFFSPRGMLRLTGMATVPQPEDAPCLRRRSTSHCFEMMVCVMDEIQVSEVKSLFLAQVWRGDYLVIKGRPCRIIDLSFYMC